MSAPISFHLLLLSGCCCCCRRRLCSASATKQSHTLRKAKGRRGLSVLILGRQPAIHNHSLAMIKRQNVINTGLARRPVPLSSSSSSWGRYIKGVRDEISAFLARTLRRKEDEEEEEKEGEGEGERERKRIGDECHHHHQKERSNPNKGETGRLSE